MSTVLKHPAADSGDLPLQVDHMAEQLRMQNARKIVDAARDYEMAVTALENARRAEAHARKAKDAAYEKLREFMKGRSRAVVDNLLITANDCGGVQIEAVDVYHR